MNSRAGPGPDLVGRPLHIVGKEEIDTALGQFRDDTLREEISNLYSKGISPDVWWRRDRSFALETRATLCCFCSRQPELIRNIMKGVLFFEFLSIVCSGYFAAGSQHC
jgi:hypothetical protein